MTINTKCLFLSTVYPWYIFTACQWQNASLLNILKAIISYRLLFFLLYKILKLKWQFWNTLLFSYFKIFNSANAVSNACHPRPRDSSAWGSIFRGHFRIDVEKVPLTFRIKSTFNALKILGSVCNSYARLYILSSPQLLRSHSRVSRVGYSAEDGGIDVHRRSRKSDTLPRPIDLPASLLLNRGRLKALLQLNLFRRRGLVTERRVRPSPMAFGGCMDVELFSHRT